MPKEQDEQKSTVMEHIQTAKRRKKTRLVVKDDGTSALVDQRDAARDVCLRVKSRLREDMHTLFQNYLLKHVPMELSKFLKEEGFTKPSGDAYLPHELVVVWKEVVNKDTITFAHEKQKKFAEIENAFKDYLKKYVETIVENV